MLQSQSIGDVNGSTSAVGSDGGAIVFKNHFLLWLFLLLETKSSCFIPMTINFLCYQYFLDQGKIEFSSTLFFLKQRGSCS